MKLHSCESSPIVSVHYNSFRGGLWGGVLGERLKVFQYIFSNFLGEKILFEVSSINERENKVYPSTRILLSPPRTYLGGGG